MEHVILAGVLASFVFVCGALINEGIQIVAKEQNRPSEATTGRIEAELPADKEDMVHDAQDQMAEADIHNGVSVKEADMMRDEERQNDARTDTVSGDERKAVKKAVMNGREVVCLPLGEIVRGFGWQEEGGVWRYHTGIDVAVGDNGDVRAAASGMVHRVEQGAGGYAVEVVVQDKLWRYEPLDEVTVSVRANVRIGEKLGCTAVGADRLHIACRCGSEWLDLQSIAKEQE